MAPRNSSSGRRVNGLVALGTAAVMTVYAAGYARTREAAERLAESERQRPPIPAPSEAGPQLPPPEPPPDLSLRSATPAAAPAATTPATRTRAAIETTARDARTENSTPPAAAAPIGQTPRAEVPSAAAAEPGPQTAAAPPTAPAAETTLTEGAHPAETIAPPVTPKVLYRDGTYSGYGTSRHGDIEATLVIAGGRITSAEISKCYTRYPCSWIRLLPPQVVQIQSPEVDFITGATVSTYAFYYALVDALNKAK